MRADKLSESFTLKVECELKRINREVEVELVRRLVSELASLFELSTQEVPPPQFIAEDPQSVLRHFLQSVVRSKVALLREKVQVLAEGKDLLMQERAQHEERLQECEGLNKQMSTKLGLQAEQIALLRKAVEEEVSKAVAAEREQANINAASVIASLR